MIKYDRRTRSGREKEVLDQIREFGGFSTFWPNQPIACAIERLKQSGKIKFETAPFPWCKAKIVKGV